MFSAITVLHHPLGQVGYSLVEVPYVFCIPISELTRQLRFPAITVLHPAQGRLATPSWNSYRYLNPISDFV